jgi:16S rRNA (cytosine967-C5)-methyltransferase
MNVRVLAARVLSRVFGQGQSLATALPPVLVQASGRDRAFLQELCYGVLRWQPRLQCILERLLEKPLKTRDKDIRALLLLGLYQLLCLRVPDHAAVSETAAAARGLGKARAVGLINGVLRNFQRRRAGLLQELEHREIYSNAHPSWLLARLKNDWPEDWRAVTESNNTRPPLGLRVNLGRISRADYLRRLRTLGVEAEPAFYSPAGLILTQPREVADLPGFEEGLVSVQDPAAQLAADLLELKAGQRVLDACAAPGGKTCHILESEPGLKDLLALDSDPRRLIQVRENLERLGLIARLQAGDARTPGAWWDGECFDRILLDAPCSGAGVIRRHPDIKVLRRAADIEQCAGRQRRLLTQVWPLLAPGGMLVYTTCSILRTENEDVIAEFLGLRPDAREQPIAAEWGRAMRHGRQILPGEKSMDGFYYARLLKSA